MPGWAEIVNTFLSLLRRQTVQLLHQRGVGNRVHRRWRTWVLAGSLPRKLPPLRSCAGRIGRAQKPPPQLGQTLCNTVSTQWAQKVHSKLQIRASSDAGGRAVLQCSQLGRSSSIEKS